MRSRLLALPVLLLSGVWAAPPVQQGAAAPALDVPYVPTRPGMVEAMLKLADVKKTDTVIDLGCGDGRIVIMAAEKFGARGVGVDINPERIKEANENARKAGVADRVKFIEGNLFDADIHAATVVTLYLLPDVNMKLRPKLLRDLKPGTRIVSHAFDLGDWKPDKQISSDYSTLYLWTVPPAGTPAAKP